MRISAAVIVVALVLVWKFLPATARHGTHRHGAAPADADTGADTEPAPAVSAGD